MTEAGGRNMVPLLKILKKRAEFLAVAQKGKKWVTPGFILQCCPASENDAAIRYGLTASIKSVGNAVKRNRARRRLRELVRELLPKHASPGFDFVMIARNETATRDFADLKKDLLWALKKLGAYHD
jgi:ribonuclease P protein component